MDNQSDEMSELENQFILRLPEEVAEQLREALRTGTLKDRMTIKMDPELRNGEVRFDNHVLPADIVDLPTIVESLKTKDKKNFYKSADISQMMICKEEPDALDAAKESSNKGQKKDADTVDKKFLWPHGITPPFKNVRNRRFRKMLKKKITETQETEKEVKRLLRMDSEAVRVEYEIINEDEIDESIIEEHTSKEFNEGANLVTVDFTGKTLQGGGKSQNDPSPQKDINVESDEDDMQTKSEKSGGLEERDILGGEVSSDGAVSLTLSSSSSSDDEEKNSLCKRQRLSQDDDDISDLYKNLCLSQDDSRMPDNSMIAGGGGNSNNKPTVTEFYTSIFGRPKVDNDDSRSKMGSFTNAASNLTTAQINAKIENLRREVNDEKLQYSQKLQDIATIQNPTLKQRFQEQLDYLLKETEQKELEIKDYEDML